MKFLLDTSVIIEIDRKNKEIIDILKALIEREDEIFISTITFSEVLAGSYSRKDFKTAVLEAKRILGQFLWIDFNSVIAEKTSEYLAFLSSKGKRIEFQDAAIAATGKIKGADYILTLNKIHFDAIPDFKGKFYAPQEVERFL